MKKILSGIYVQPESTKKAVVAAVDSAAMGVYLPGFSSEQSTAFREDYLILPDHPSINPTRRIIVLVPGGELKEDELARRVWQLATRASLNILYVALSPDMEYTPYLKRRLVTLAASTTFDDVKASSMTLEGNDWARALENLIKPGDLLVSIAKESMPSRLIGRKALGEILSAAFNLPVYMLTGIDVGRLPEQSNMVKNLVAWALSIAVIVAFGVFQIGLDKLVVGPDKTILFCCSLVAEGFLIWKINEWLG
jgi:hypothetical protein